MRISPLGAISGKVVDQDGQPLPRVMAPGVYAPRPAKQGFETRTADRFATARDFPPFTVTAGSAVTGLELHLIPDSVITGRVTDADGDSLRHVSQRQVISIS